MLPIRRLIYRIIILPILLSLLSGTLACGPAAAAFSPLTVLSAASGHVQVLKTGGQDWADAKEGMSLDAGDRIKTDAAAKATITFFDGSTIDLSANTEISLDDLLSKTNSNPKTIKIGQKIGETASNVVKLVDPASRYEVDTTSAVAAVRGSQMVVQVTADGTTRVYNVEGAISITAQGKEVMIPAGSSSTAKPGEAPAAPQPGTPPAIGTSNATSISSRAGWQQTGLLLKAGDKYYVDYRGGSWTVDYTKLTYVGPAGYSADLEKVIGGSPIARLDSAAPYGSLLGKVGSGKEMLIGKGDSFTADAGGYLSLRINDSDSSLADNDGAITVVLRGPETAPQLSTGSSGPVALNVPVSGSGGFNYTQGSYLEGFEFKANTAINITHLGAYDSNYSQLPNGAEAFAPVEVAVYNLTTHTLLGSVTVKASDPVTGVFHYASLAAPIKLNTTDNYAVVWVSSTNRYIANPTLTLSDINSAITYVGAIGYGSGGLTQTRVMVEPNYFYKEAEHGLSALNYDIGPNFMFVTN